jgi:hypothetical protein
MIEPTEWAWLAGLIDGEGCLYSRSMKYRDTNAIKGIETRLEIQAASSRMIDAVVSILNRADIEYIRDSPRMQPMSTRPAHKIRISKKLSLQRLLIAVSPYMIVKKPEAMCVLGFLERSCAVKYYRYTEEDFTLTEEIRGLKRIA